MLSYIIASFRPDAVRETLKSIRRLAKHDHEIIVCTPYPDTDFDNVRFILDDKKCGSTYAFNKAASVSNGEWVVVGIDDHVINIDINALLDITQHPAIAEMEYQVINLGSPWTDCLNRNIAGYGIDIGTISIDVLNARWPVITFPAVSRKTILEKFDGYIFNPHLQHHFVDHWIGLYVSRKQSDTCIPHANHNSWTAHVSGDYCDRSRDNTDSVMFCKLAARFLQNPTIYGYTTPYENRTYISSMDTRNGCS